VRVAIEQGGAEVLFEYRNTLSDGRRGQILSARGSCDGTQFGNADQAFQVTNIQL
jgi:hypothetical protein